MYFPQFLVGMFSASFIMAIWADIETGSVWTALGWAILAMIIFQIGYIGLVVRLIYKRASEGADASQASVRSVSRS
jgi:exopolysaccharide production repressor protein